MSEQFVNENLEDEISLKDILDFLLESWQQILLVGVIGILAAIAFLLIATPQYEATAQVQMAQIPTSNTNTNPLGVNIEDPNMLIARFKLPSTYTVEQIKACGLENAKMPAESIAEMVKVTPVKSVGSTIELKVRGESKQLAVACAESIFGKIHQSQNEILAPYIEEAKNLLAKYQARLSEAQSLMSRADKSGSALTAAYLANRDEVKYSTDEIIRLNTIIASANTRSAKLVSPIYASDKATSPKKSISLVLGLLGGLFLGLLLVLVRKAWANYKNTNQ
jgi:uncharacterized protein involved in exopolysaccharide biosynthesis